MILDPATYLILTALALLLFWSAPAAAGRLREAVLTGFSVLVVYTVSPVALAICLGMTGLAWLTLRLSLAYPSDRWLAGGIACVAAVLVAGRFGLEQFKDALPMLGISYVALKTIAAMVHGAYYVEDQGRPVPFGRLLLLNVFYPIYTAGPIERLETFQEHSFACRFDWRAFAYGLARIITGIFKISFFSANLLSPMIAASYGQALTNPFAYSPGECVVFLWLCLLELYFNFSGYTDVAVGTARLFGITVMENFHYPFLAVSIKDFWKRWHISMANFVMDYLFMPIARATGGRLHLAIVASFVIIGLWHKISFSWLVWGLLQGGAFVAAVVYGQFMRSRPLLKSIHASKAHAVASWFLTMNFVALAVAYSRGESMTDVLNFTLRLLTPWK